MFYLYVLYSDLHFKHYIGYTIDLDMRMKSHNELGSGWTKKYRPWRIIYGKEFERKDDAMKYESWLKTGVGREFISTLPH
jgi:putative endonuclease